MTYSKGSELPAPKQPAAKMKEGVQDRRCKPNVEPWRPGGRRPGHPRHRTVRHHRRPAEDLPTPGTLATSGRDRAHLGHLFPYLPKQPGYNKRLRAAAALLQQLIRALASDTTFWTDDVWVADSTPVECGRSTQTVHRSELAGWAEYGYCASHSRYFWGLRLHLVCTLQGLPVGFALSGAKADEREVLLGILAADPALLAQRPGQTLIADKNYFGGAFEAVLAEQGVRLLRPARKGEPERAGAHLFKPLRQVIESINQTFKGQLDLERHGGHTPAGVIVRVLQRILALTAAIWHNDHTGQPTPRSLVAYDH